MVHRVVTDRGPVLAALIAAVCGAPSLALPFLSDDWVHVVTASEGTILQTSFGFFRPLCNISYWVDWRIWGQSPAPFHLTNVLLASLAAALVVILARRYTGCPILAGLAGVLFALHPYHVGTVAWIAARSDLLSAVLVLLAAWAYDRWRERSGGLPLAALALYEAAMLAKESAVVLPGVLVVIGLLDARRRPTSVEWLRGLLPLLVVGLAHFALVRTTALGGISLNHLKWIGLWRGNLLSYGVTSVVPPPPEIFHQHPWPWGLVAVVIVGVLVVAGWLRTRRIPSVIWPAAAVFPVLLGPSLIGFQLRYFFLPGAVAMLALAALLRGAGARVGGGVAGILLAGWMATAAEQWKGQFEAAATSQRLLESLTMAGRGGDETIVAVAIPHRVHGVPVTTDYSRVITFLSGRQVMVRTATEFDYPTGRADARAEGADLRFAVERRPYSRLVLPLFPEGEDRVTENWGTIVREGRDAARIQLHPSSEARFYVWQQGDLVPLR